MTYSSTMIANNILSRTFAGKAYISPMKLQRVLYFVASEYQKATKRPLLEESFSTWAYGPVLYSVYDEFRSFGRGNITCYARDARGDMFGITESQDIELKVALERVWDKTKSMSAVELSEITIKTATGGVELTVTPVDKGQNRRAYSSRKMQDWFMFNELFGSEDNWMQFCNAYVGKVIKKYREESNC